MPSLPAPGALDRAHAMHQQLRQVPLAQRTPADYEAIVAVLATVWREPGRRDADSARFEAANIYVDEARDLADQPGSEAVVHAAYLDAARAFLDLLHVSPYTAYRRNAEWALAQVQIFHLHEAGAAKTWLRDFEHRYPADLRVSLAHKEVLGERIPEPAYLVPSEPKAILPSIAPPPAAAASASRSAPSALPSAPSPAAPSSAEPARAPRKLDVTIGVVRGIEVFSNSDSTSVVIALGGQEPFSRGAIPSRNIVYFDIGKRGRPFGGESRLAVNDGRVLSIEAATRPDGQTRVVIETSSGAHADRGRLFPNPDRLVVGITGAGSVSSARPGPLDPPDPPRPAQMLASGGSSLTRALGLKISRIVLDAGHGGHDTGTIAPDGLEEKNVVLDVTLRLGKLLQSRLGVDVVYTRRNDTFIPLEERTAIANRAHADLFVSIHANSSPDPSAHGIETYFLDLTQNTQAMAVAARENAGDEATIHDLPALVRRIALNDKMQESHELADDIEASLSRVSGQGNRGVKSAPFVVLIGAQMPSVLAEISFLSNRGDDRLLRQPAYRQRLAEGLYQGLVRYIHSLSAARTSLASRTSPLAVK